MGFEDEVGSLASALKGWMVPGFGPVESVTYLAPSTYGSTWDAVLAEVVCGELTVRILLKGEHASPASWMGLPTGPAYEGVIYEEFLPGVRSYDSPYLGRLTCSGRTWIVLHWLDDALRLSKARNPESMLKASSWLGEFHATGSRLVGRVTPWPVNRYPDDFVLRWAKAALEVLGSRAVAGRSPGFLHDVAERAQRCLDASDDLTVVHGEFYPANVLVNRGSVVPVDWEWAGIAPRWLDLAALVEGWGEEVASACVEVYAASWTGRSTGSVERKVWAARVYFSMRFLARRKKYQNSPDLWVQDYSATIAKAWDVLAFDAPGGLS